MAYSFTATKTGTSADGSFLYTVVETDNVRLSGGGTDEFTLSVPSSGRIIRWKAYISDGANFTIAPVMGESTAPANQDIVVQLSSSSTTVDIGNVDEQPIVSPVYSGSTMYCRSNVKAATGTFSGTVTHKFYFRPLWRR